MGVELALTAERLRQLLHYDPATGVFTWLVASKYQPHLLGKTAGCFDARGYIVIRISGKGYKAHRLAWLYVHGEWPDGILDHEKGIFSDNRIAKLRLATPSQNSANTGRLSRNTSGYKGVNRVGGGGAKLTKPWQVRIMANGRRRLLGYFASAEEAHAVYAAEATKLYGEFARTA